MGLKHILISLLLLGWACSLSAQTAISGRVTDAETGSPLPGATVQISGHAKGAITNDDGRYELDLVGTNVVLRVQYLGYEPQVECVFLNKQKVYDFALKPQAVSLETTTITAQKLQLLYPDKKTMVIDYEFLKDDVLVIVYDPARKRNVLQLLSSNFAILSEYDNAAEPPRALFKDCLGASHAISTHFASQVDVGFANHLILRSDSLHLFQKIVEPCQAHIDSIYYYASMPNAYVKQFTFVNHYDKHRQKLYTCIDKKSMGSVLDESKMAAIDAETFEDPMRAAFFTDLNMCFLKAITFPPIYVPIMVISGKVCVFDHPHARLLRFDFDGKIYDHAPLAYQELPDWRREVFTNAEEDEVFTLTEKGGYFTVHRIDLKTGTLTEHWELPFPFVQKIRVRGQYIYFTYRNNSEDQVKRLFRLEM